MAMHNTNSLLKYIAIPTLIIFAICLIFPLFHNSSDPVEPSKGVEKTIKDTASDDNASESLNTLTADLSTTKQKIMEVSQANKLLKQQNEQFISQQNEWQKSEGSRLTQQIDQLKNQIQDLMNTDHTENAGMQSITIVEDLTKPSKEHELINLPNPLNMEEAQSKPSPIIPYYTIPANGTSVHDKLMTALVGRIPVKGVVTDPYPFKIVISDDNLAANGLRVPHLLQMIVSGYCEGDLNLISVRGWVTSLTFVFDDGTISSTTSNENDIGNFTKANSLGYLSDKYGNPFIRGKLITNAPAYLAGNVAISAGVGAANAYSQQQVTTNTSMLGNSNSSVTGSPGKYIAGEALVNSATEVQKWWHDREEQSFDAIYVAPVDDKNKFVEIAVNFAKEIHIDYDKNGRKLDYAHHSNAHVSHHLD